jgi:acetoin utilization deacetylase AcuC-like enzyme
MTAPGYTRLVHRLRAASLQSGALALVTEGGYDLAALRECLAAVIDVIDAESDAGDGQEPQAVRAPRGERALTAVRATQSPFWRGL